MKKSTILFLFFSCLIFKVQLAQDPAMNRLKILTVNVWSGLDYDGAFKMGEYENEDRREKRFEILCEQIKELDPDIILMQEANPVGHFTSKLADVLDYGEIHQVCMAGIKFGPIGIPTNFKEGIAILARKNMQLQLFKVKKLSGSFGIYGDLFTFHLNESIFAIVGKIVIDDTPIFIINTHLYAADPVDQVETARQRDELSELIEIINDLPQNSPVILGGDFNAVPKSEEIKDFINTSGFTDSFSKNDSPHPFTWDPERNENIQIQLDTFRNLNRKPHNDLQTNYDSVGRKIDYIFLSPHFNIDDVRESKIVFDSSVDGIHSSDHFGVLTELDLGRVIDSSDKEFKTVSDLHDNTLEPLPILSYDTDVGFGYGAKSFFLNYLGVNESIDVVFFNSTEGERWYRFVFSIPDFELRQGKIYSWAIDLVVDYDKWIKNSFFGIGNDSKLSEREYYTKEPFEISVVGSKGFTENLVAQFGLRYKSIKNFNITDSSKLYVGPVENISYADFGSAFMNLRYDTRNSYINPSRGFVVQSEIEFAPKLNFTSTNFLRTSLSLQHYCILFYPTTVLAGRLILQGVFGNNLPVQSLLSIGGNNSLRGFPNDRFIDSKSALVNLELRFPLFWRFGGILGIDAGKVGGKITNLNFLDWHSNYSAGLRFYFDTFIVRLDFGFSSETTGFFLNFGQIF